MPTARASDLPLLIVNGADSPRSRIGRGLESIGSMTAETLQRISTTVGGVVKSPVVLMAKVGGLASPRAAPLTAPPGSSLEERVFHLETQVKSFEERFSSRIIVTELDISSCLQKEKPHIAKSLLQEMEMEGTLVKRVQMLEDHVNERMERIEKVLSSIQSQLEQVKFSRHGSVIGYEHPENLSDEPQYYDAEQQSDNLEDLEVAEQKFFGAHVVPSEATGSSPPLEKETLSATPTPPEHVEPLQEIDIGKNDDFLDPQVVSTSVYSKEAFLTQPMKSVAPSSEPAKSSQKDDAGNFSASLDRQLASTLEELHGSYVTESLAAAASAKFLETARAVTNEKSPLAYASSKPQSVSALKEPWGAFLEEPPIAKSKEHAQEDNANKSGTTIAAVESPLPLTFEATHKDFMKEPLVIAPNANLAQELATQGVFMIALASPEPSTTSKSVEEPLMVVPSANSKKSSQEDMSSKSVTMTAIEESLHAFAFQDPQEDFVKEFLASAPSVGPIHESSSQEDLNTTSDIALASSESSMASKSMEEPSVVAFSSNFEELAQEDVVKKSGNTIATAELPMALSLEEPKESFEKEFIASAPSGKPAQEYSDMAIESFETKGASKFVEEALPATPSANFGERAHKTNVDKNGSINISAKSPLESSFANLQEDFEKESLATTPSAKPTHKSSSKEDSGATSDKAPTTFEPQVESKFVEEPSSIVPCANFKEPTQDEDAIKNNTMSVGVDSPLVSSFEEPKKDFEKESLATTSSHESTQGLATKVDSHMVPTSFESQRASKSMEEPLPIVSITTFEEPAQDEDAIKSETMSVGANSPLTSSFEEPKEDFEKESLPTTLNHKSSQGLATKEGSHMVPTSLESQEASKSREEPLAAVLSASFEEPVQEEDALKSETMSVVADAPLTSSLEESQEDFEKESLATTSSHESTQGLATKEDSQAESTSFDSQEASKSMEEPSAIGSSATFGEPTQDEDAVKSDTMSIEADSPLSSSLEEPKEDFENESNEATPSNKLTQGLATKEDSHMVPTSFESQEASKSMEEPSAIGSSATFGEPTQDEDAVKSDTMSASADSPLSSSLEEPKEDFEKESLATSSSHESTQGLATKEDSQAESTSFDSQEASKSMEEPSAIGSSATFGEPTQDEDAVKSDTMSLEADSPLSSSLEESQEDFEKESLATTSSHESTQGLATKEGSHMVPTSFESQEASKSMEEPSAIGSSATFGEPTQDEDAVKSDTMSLEADSPLSSSLEESQEDFEKESLATSSSHESTQGLATKEGSHMVPTSFESQEASKSMEEPSAIGSGATFGEPTQDEDAVKSDTMSLEADSPLSSSLEESQEDFEKESLATSSSHESTQGLATKEDSQAESTSFESQEASKSMEEPSAIGSSATFGEPTQDEDAVKSDTMSTSADSPLSSSLEEPKKDFEKESLATSSSHESTQGLATKEDSQAESTSFDSQEASKSMEEPSAIGSSATFGEPTQDEDAIKSDTMSVDADSPLSSSLEESQEDFEKESLATSSSHESTQGLATKEDSQAESTSFDSQEASKSMEEPSAIGSSATFGEPTQDEDAVKSDTMSVDADSPLSSSLEEPKEDFENESNEATPSHESTQGLATKEDSQAESTSFESQEASKSMEEPSAIGSSATFGEPTQDEDAIKSDTMSVDADSPLSSSLEEPKEDFEKESLATSSSHESTQGLATKEDSKAESTSFESQEASKSMEEPLAIGSSATFGEPTQDEDAVKSDTMSVDANSPLSSSLEETKEDFEKGSLATSSSHESTQGLATKEDSQAESTSFDSQEASKSMEEPSAIGSSATFGEPTQDEDAVKSDTMSVDANSPLSSSLEETKEDFEKGSLATSSSHESTQGLATKEDSQAESTSFDSQEASKSMEEPSAIGSSATFGEPTQDEDAVKSDTMSVDADSPLSSSLEESQEDFEKESLATSSSHESTQGLATKEDSQAESTSFESQEASKSVEEPLAIGSSATFGEPTQDEDAVKSDTMSVDADSPLSSSLEEPKEDFENESNEATPSTKLTQGLATQQDSDMVPFELLMASKFVERPLAVDVPSAKFDESAHKDIVNKSGTVIVATELASMSSLEEHKEDSSKESLAAREIAKVLGPTKVDESRESPIAFAPLEAPSTSFFGIPQEAFAKEPSKTSVDYEEPLQEKNGIVFSDAESTLTSTIEEGNHAAKGVEYKLAEDFKIYHEPIKSVEKEFPQSEDNLAHVCSDKLKLESLATEDNDDRLNSDESSEEFFDAEHGSGNFEPWEFGEPKSFKDFGVVSDEPSEALGINGTTQKETLVPASSAESEQALAQQFKQHPNEELEQQLGEEHGKKPPQEHGQAPGQEPNQEPTQGLGHKPKQQFKQQPDQESEQEDLSRKSGMALPPIGAQVTSNSKESQEMLDEETLAIVPSTKFGELAQANAIDESGTRNLPLTSTAEKSPSSASFNQNDNLELLESLEQKSSNTPNFSSTCQEALEKESLIAAPTNKIAHGHEVGKSDNVHTSLEPHMEESKEAPTNELVKVVPSSKLIDSAQEVGDGQSGAIIAPLEPQLEPKSVYFEESLANEPLIDTTSAKFVEESVATKVSAGLDEELPLTSIAEEPQNENGNSLVEGKYGKDEADWKFLEDVRIIAKPIEEAIPRTQCDLTHIKLNLESIEDATKLQSPGGSLALGTTSMDSKEALVKKPLPSAKLLELFEEEHNFGKRGSILGDSPVTSTMEEPQKPLAEEPLVDTKSIPKSHARRRGFFRSSTEPRFAYKLEEHQKALVKESSMVAIPSTSKLGEEHAQEDFADPQCLPSRTLGKGKLPQNELDFKLVEDVKSPAMKSETTSSPYVLEPKPSKIKDIKEKKEKKKKEKKEKKLVAEEKERRLLLGLGEIKRKSSLKAKEKDIKHSLQAEEKHKQPFKHLRDRLRRTFSVKKES